jgi:ABC-type multidrug transport system fused ATPase/permease subunit
MFTTLQESDPQSTTEEAAFSTWMEQTSERQIARIDRIQGAEGILPWPLWVALFFTAAVIFAYMLFFADSAERAVVQAMHVGTVIAVITITLILIAVLSNPHGSRLDILKPTAMERTLTIFDEVAGTGQQAEPPCNAEGDPLGS